jgi:hypothetical protein
VPLQESFYAFCNASKAGSKAATDKTVKKIFTDCKFFGKALTQAEMDIKLRKVMGNKAKEADLAMFEAFLKEVAPAYGKDHSCTPEEAVAQMKEKISSTGPGQTGVTKASGDAATQRLTDVAGYTGAHKERFDAESGKGKGIEGRVDRDAHAAAGYVGNYKNAGAYDQSHK